jgi:hypothetical protein
LAQVPVVTSEAFLQLYPCLRDAPIHRAINRHPSQQVSASESASASESGFSECASMKRAYRLSEEDYAAAKEEVRQCSAQLWNHALQTLINIIGIKS